MQKKMSETTMKEKCDFVFVILTYRNTEDVKECIDSISKANFGIYKIVIVDAYYDDSTRDRIRKIADSYSAYFLSIENKGYGYGNNRGVEYCNKMFDYDYLIISNPDITVSENRFSFNKIKGEKAILAPCINNIKGKRQNPYWVKHNRLFINLMYRGYLTKNRLLLWIGLFGNKIQRLVFNLKEHSQKKIYAAHGSFVIFTKELVSEIEPIYDENVFLFSEEAILAKKMNLKDLKTYYTDQIKIKHKEDGSMDLAKINEMSELRKSFLYYYETYEKERPI